MWTGYSEVIKYLLQMYVTENVIATMDVEIIRITQTANMTPTEYAGALQNKAVCCDFSHDEYVLNRTLTEGLHGPIGHSTCLYWSSRNNATVHDLARQVTSLNILQYGLQSTENSNTIAKQSMHRGNTNSRREAQKTTKVAHVNGVFT